MKIEKRGNSYRVRKTIQGKSYCFSFDHRPTQAEVQKMIQNVEDKQNGKITFRTACDSYIEARTNSLSPSTIREYRGTASRFSDQILDKKVDDITQNDIQLEINRMAKDKSPKTVRNYHGFLSAVLGEFRPEMVITTTLPMKDRKEPYIPNTDDIKAILKEAEGTPMELPILLACAGLRRGEICALTDADVEGNIIHINKSLVFDDKHEWKIKRPKTPESIRDIYVPDKVVQIIEDRGMYVGNPNNISDWLIRTENKLGIEHFTVHKLRHFFASESHANGVPDADIMKFGGWKTDYVMKSVYRHSMADNSAAVSNAVFGSIL